MRLSTADSLVGIMAGMRLNRIADREVKATLVDEYLRLRRLVKDAYADREALIEKFQDDWADELDAVEAFRMDGRPVVGHDAYLEAERDANVCIAGIFSREVEVEVHPVGMDAFLASCGDEEVTLEQLAVLQDAGIVA